jgi:CDP-glycerol glycerophosphotransferase (TagB/SpsB family)
MTLKSDRRDLSYSEITELALSMPAKEKLHLAEELKREGLKADWEYIFRSLKPNQVSEEEILKVSKQVRRKLNARRSRATAARRR